MLIGSFNTENTPLLVAEIGNNHEGNFENAKALVRKVAEAGAPAVKFQTFKTAGFVSEQAEPARFKRLSSFELTYAQFRELRDLAKSLGLLFLSTPLDLESADFLNELVDAFKIASGDNNFYALLEKVAATGKPVILSAGLSDLEQIQKSKRVIEAVWSKQHHRGQLAVLHCVSSYPVPAEQANLAAIRYLQEKLDCAIGYSDHTMGLEACRVSAAMGAEIIEKHFTLSKNFSDFRDHQLSVDPVELVTLVSDLKQIRTLLGSGGKPVQECEAANRTLIRRSIAAAGALPKGHRLASSDLMWLRPGTGLPPGEETQLVGRRTSREIASGELIQAGDLE